MRFRCLSMYVFMYVCIMYVRMYYVRTYVYMYVCTLLILLFITTRAFQVHSFLQLAL